MFLSVMLVIILLIILRKALANRVLKPLLSCEDTLHYLYRYCAVSQSEPCFLEYYKAREEFERRQSAIMSVVRPNFSRFCMNFLIPSERKYYTDFADKIPELKAKAANAYAEYMEFMERKVEEENVEKDVEEAKIIRRKDSGKRREKKAMRKQSIGNLMQATAKSF